MMPWESRHRATEEEKAAISAMLDEVEARTTAEWIASAPDEASREHVYKLLYEEQLEKTAKAEADLKTAEATCKAVADINQSLIEDIAEKDETITAMLTEFGEIRAGLEERIRTLEQAAASTRSPDGVEPNAVEGEARSTGISLTFAGMSLAFKFEDDK